MSRRLPTRSERLRGMRAEAEKILRRIRSAESKVARCEGSIASEIESIANGALRLYAFANALIFVHGTELREPLGILSTEGIAKRDDQNTTKRNGPADEGEAEQLTPSGGA